MTMLLRELLPPEHILVPLEAATFRDAVVALVRRLHSRGHLRDLPAIEKALVAARGRDIVAIGPDVALPHFRTDAVDQLQLAIAIVPAAMDVRDTGLTSSPRIIALVLAPPEAASRYLQTVAALARLFRDPQIVERLATAQSPEEVLAIGELTEVKVQPDLRVRDVMTLRTEGIAPNATVRHAVDLMLRHNWRALPVVGEKGEVLGILTEWDVMHALLPEIPHAGEGETQDQGMLVKEAMTRSVFCISEEMSLEEAVNLMINKNIEQFPVVSDGALTGMLVRADIIRKLFGR